MNSFNKTEAAIFIMFLYVLTFYCLLQWTVGGRTGVFGPNVTSAVELELAHEPDRVQTHFLHMVVTIARDRHKKQQRVHWHIAQVE